MGKRSFDQMAVVATGSQGFHDRFGSESRYDRDSPPISQWRCNLTALSQVHNLYFVAYAHKIYVYVPQFPSQAIPVHPALIVHSQPSSRNLPGYLDERNPHSINNLIIQYLGNEEVVAVVRDDGDVDAFLVRQIVQAIERRNEPETNLSVTSDEVRPFFQSNVGISAWGLAIHSEARILATSSNAHEVRIFKFGLLQVDDDDGTNDVPTDDDADEESPETGRRKDERRQRKTDVTHHVLNGETNIPYISFCNTGDDPEARWLLTTDISGVCRVMDLHTLQPVQAFRFGPSLAGPIAGGFDRLNAGWGIMFLDRRSFQAKATVQDALGMEESESKLPGLARDPKIWDLSRTTKRFPESSQPFVYRRSNRQERVRRSPRQRRRPRAEDTAAETTEMSISAASERESTFSGSAADPVEDVNSSGIGTRVSDINPELESEDDSSDGGAPVDIEIDLNNNDDEDDEDEGEMEIDGPESATANEDGTADEPTISAPGAWVSDTESIEEDRAWHIDLNRASLISSDSESANDMNLDEDGERQPDLIDDGEDPDDEGTEDSIPFNAFYNGDSICGNGPRFVHNTTGLCANLPCPILHTSVRNIYMLQPSSENRPDVSPLLGFANPLRQTIEHDFEYLRLFERLNMHASIPSLGIVILASQKGRAIVLSQTKLSPSFSTYHPPVMFQGDKTTYCMRVEALLPFVAQEQANERPFAPLHGIAVGPMQGSDRGAKRGRWRLLMMYQDHSILSYEIRREGGDGVDVEGLIV